MKQIAVLLVALVAAVAAFFLNTQGAVEACGAAVVTFFIFLLLGSLVIRVGTRKDDD